MRFTLPGLPAPFVPVIALGARALLALLFLHEAWVKLGNYAGALGYMQKFGLPEFLLPAAIALELGGGAALLLGGTAGRLAALALAGFCLLTAALFHSNFAVMNEVLHFEKDLAIAGGLILFAISAAPDSAAHDRAA